MQAGEIHTKFLEFFNAGDAESLVGLYEDGAAFVAEPEQVLIGKEQIRAAIDGFLAMKGTMTMTTRYVVEAGDVALLSGDWVLRGTGEDGSPVELSGKSAEVARRQGDGRWLYVADHPFGGS